MTSEGTDIVPLPERTEQPLSSPARDEADTHMKAETAAGRRLQKVALENGALVMQGNDAAQQRVAEAFGSDSREFQTYCISQLIQTIPQSSDDTDFTLPMNAAVEMLHAIAPQNALEAMLAVQMIASHHLGMKAAARTGRADMLPQYQANGNLSTKFARTFVAQLEALDRHRRGGKQIVEHLHVNQGGQAIIAGTVNTGGGRND